MHIHHPGREAGVAAGGNSSGGSPQQPHVVLDMFKQSGPGGGDGSGRQSAIDQDSFTAGSGGSAAAARIDQPGSGPSGEGLEGPRNLNAGVEATNAVAGRQHTTALGGWGCMRGPAAVTVFFADPMYRTTGSSS